MADNLNPISVSSLKRESDAQDASRRQFFQRALAVASALAAIEQLPAQQAVCPAPPAGGVKGTPMSGAELPKIGEIASGADNILHATVTIDDENKWFWAPKANTTDSGGFY